MAKKTRQTDPDNAESPQVRMTFGEHLEELRRRIMLALVGSLAGIVLCTYYSNHIVFALARPYILALKTHHYPGNFIYNKPPEIVISYLTIGLQAGLVLSSPWIIYQLWLFIAAGLYPRERSIVYKYIGPSAVLFLLGVAFFYFFVLPLSLNFFVGFTENTAQSNPQPTWIERRLGLNPSITESEKIPPGDQANIPPIPVVSSDPPKPPEGAGYLYYNSSEGTIKFRVADEMLTLMVVQAGSLFANVPRWDEYIDFVTWTSLVFGLAFEMPMVILVLAQVGIVSVATFRKMRKYAYFGLAIASAIASPSTDVLTMLCLMVPLIGLYEAGILAATIVTRRQAADDD